VNITEMAASMVESMLDGDYWKIKTACEKRASRAFKKPVPLPALFFQKRKTYPRKPLSEEQKKRAKEKRDSARSLENLKIIEEHKRNEEKQRRKFEGCKVLDHILLGGKLVAKNEERLEKSKVVAILNVTSSVQNYFENENKFVYKRIDVQDSGDEKIEDYFPEAVTFILDHIGPDRRVLVHCEEGQSRSPTIVIAWMMKYFNITLKEAYEKFLGIVGEDYIGINDGFLRKLMDWDVLLHNHKSMDFFGRSKNVSRKYSESNMTLREENESIPNPPIEHDLPTSPLPVPHTLPKRKERNWNQTPVKKRKRLSDNSERIIRVIDLDSVELATDVEKRAHEAEKRASEAEKRASEAEKRAHEAENRAIEAEKRAHEVENRAMEAEKRAHEVENRAMEAEKRLYGKKGSP